MKLHLSMLIKVISVFVCLSFNISCLKVCQVARPERLEFDISILK